METTVTVLLAIVVLAVLAVAMSFVLGWANRAFHVEVDQKVEAVLNVLPGANCGGCGYVGCGEYAEAVAAGKAAIDLCGPGGADTIHSIAAIMGVSAGEALPYRAVVHCRAGYEHRLLRSPYQGEKTCVAANLISGVQGCTYGCLGFGDCSRACNYDAIQVVDGLARIDYDKCIGCKACAAVCPRNIISMVPFKSERMLVVGCSNQDFGVEVKQVCSIGCIGCKACTRDTELVEMQGNLPSINYDFYEASGADLLLSKCRMAGFVYVGKPTPQDVAAVADEVLPDRVTADFKTTVDETEWRG